MLITIPGLQLTKAGLPWSYFLVGATFREGSPGRVPVVAWTLTDWFQIDPLLFLLKLPPKRIATQHTADTFDPCSASFLFKDFSRSILFLQSSLLRLYNRPRWRPRPCGRSIQKRDRRCVFACDAVKVLLTLIPYSSPLYRENRATMSVATATRPRRSGLLPNSASSFA